MNFIVSGDWHIKISNRIPREWQVERYRMLFQVVLDCCTKYNAELILTGDLLDSARPNLDELSLFLQFIGWLKRKQVPAILISGNHEETCSELSVYDYLGIEALSNPNYTCAENELIRYGDGVYQKDNCRFVAVNHNTIRGFTEQWHPQTCSEYPTILLSHFRCNVNDYIREEVPVDEIAAKFDLVLCSDIHQPLSRGNVHYTNHPLNSSFESNPECGLILLSVNSDINIERIPLHLPNLIKHDCEAKDFETLVQSLDPFHYHKVAVRGTPAELRAIPNTFPQGITEKTVIMDEVTFELDSGAAGEKEEKSEGATDDLVKYARRLGWGEEQVKRMVEIMEEV